MIARLVTVAFFPSPTTVSGPATAGRATVSSASWIAGGRHRHRGLGDREADRRRVEPVVGDGLGGARPVDDLAGHGRDGDRLEVLEADRPLGGGAVELRAGAVERLPQREAVDPRHRGHVAGAEQRGEARPGVERLLAGAGDGALDVELEARGTRVDRRGARPGLQRHRLGEAARELGVELLLGLGLAHPADLDPGDGDPAGHVGGGDQQIADVEHGEQTDHGRADEQRAASAAAGGVVAGLVGAAIPRRWPLGARRPVVGDGDPLGALGVGLRRALRGHRPRGLVEPRPVGVGRGVDVLGIPMVIVDGGVDGRVLGCAAPG